MRKTLLRLLGSDDHKYVTKSELNEVNNKLDAIIKHENITLVSNPSYEVETSKEVIGFGREDITS